MKKQLLGLLLLLILAPGAAAQTGAAAQAIDKTVEKIRGVYNDVAEKARLAETDDDRGQFGPLVMNELVVNKRNHQWRSVGIYHSTYRFFYKGGESEAHMYPDQLVLVKTERHVSSRKYTEEYLFSDAGVLIFYFQKTENDDQAPAERRVYFSGLRAVRIVEDGKTRDRLTPKDSRTAKEVLRQSTEARDVFIKMTRL